MGSSSETGSHADVRLQLNLKNTFGTSNFNVNNTHSNVYRFIYDKTSVDLINELKNASEASHSTSSASLTTQNGQIMEVPSNFNPHELNSAITQGVDFTDSVFNEFSSFIIQNNLYYLMVNLVLPNTYRILTLYYTTHYIIIKIRMVSPKPLKQIQIHLILG